MEKKVNEKFTVRIDKKGKKVNYLGLSRLEKLLGTAISQKVVDNKNREL